MPDATGAAVHQHRLSGVRARAVDQPFGFHRDLRQLRRLRALVDLCVDRLTR